MSQKSRRGPARGTSTPRRRAASSRRSWPAALAVAAVMVVVVILLMRGGGGGSSAPTPVGVSGADRSGDPAAVAAARNGARRPTGPVEAQAIHDDDGTVRARRVDSPLTAGAATYDPEATARAIAAYREQTKYPPTTNALRSVDVDLLDPDHRPEQPTASRGDSDLQIIYTGDHLGLTGDERLTSWLQAERDGQAAPVKMIGAAVRVIEPALGEATPLTYTQVDGRWQHVLDPSTLGVTTPVTLGMTVTFDAGGGVEQRVLHVAYTPTAAIPARFTGTFRDVVENGSLVIYAGIEVAQAGFFLIDCNLYGPGNEPVAWTRFKGDLPQGAGEVRLEFFGKLLRDQGVEPPFHIGQLRGARRVELRDPSYDQMELGAWSYTTRSDFHLADLSDAEFDDDHKRHMIDLMQANGVKPEPAPAPAPAP